MLQPSYTQIMDRLNSNLNDGQKKINSRYSIVIMVAKRARQINNTCEKPVSVATDELYSGKLKIIF